MVLGYKLGSSFRLILGGFLNGLVVSDYSFILVSEFYRFIISKFKIG